MNVEASFAVGTRLCRVMAPKQNAPGRNVASVIADRQIAECQDRGVDAGMKALGKARFAPVGRSKSVAEAGNPADMVAPGACAERDGFRPMLAPDREQPGRDLIERSSQEILSQEPAPRGPIRRIGY